MLGDLEEEEGRKDRRATGGWGDQDRTEGWGGFKLTSLSQLLKTNKIFEETSLLVRTYEGCLT